MVVLIFLRGMTVRESTSTYFPRQNSVTPATAKPPAGKPEGRPARSRAELLAGRERQPVEPRLDAADEAPVRGADQIAERRAEAHEAAPTAGPEPRGQHGLHGDPGVLDVVRGRARQLEPEAFPELGGEAEPGPELIRHDVPGVTAEQSDRRVRALDEVHLGEHAHHVEGLARIQPEDR